MDIILYTNSISPHQLPVALRLAEAGHSFCYVAQGQTTGRREMGWNTSSRYPWVLELTAENKDALLRRVETCDVLLTGVRGDGTLFERRAQAGKISIYMFERWLKPGLGMLRLLHPRYLRMTLRVVRLIRCGAVALLPCGVHAAQDMVRLCGLFGGDWRCLFRAPKLTFARNPMGQLWLTQGQGKRYCTEQMRLWGYFVEPSERRQRRKQGGTLNILWVGRMLGLKRVDVLMKSVKVLLSEGERIRLRVAGLGPEKENLKALAGKWTESGEIMFTPPVPIREVRGLMQEADVYVLSSNGEEGWGAVVNEAMEEGCVVVGTYEAGSSMTMIENGVNGLLFHSGDVRSLVGHLRALRNDAFRRQLAEAGQRTAQHVWSAHNAAEKLVGAIEDMTEGAAHNWVYKIRE